MQIHPWMWALWIAVGFTMEMIGVFDHAPNDTLTATIVTYVPAVWIILAATWVLAHFQGAVKRKGKEL
jgi:hypothetical protein